VLEMKKIKRIAFDMDGTIANLYGFDGWLDRFLTKGHIFHELQPLVDMVELNSLCEQLKAKGYEIMIITWLPMHAGQDYKDLSRDDKKTWLSKYFPMVEEIHAVQYGADKHRVTKGLENCLLFDDIDKIRDKWEKFGGVAKDETQILETLRELLAS